MQPDLRQLERYYESQMQMSEQPLERLPGHRDLLCLDLHLVRLVPGELADRVPSFGHATLLEAPLAVLQFMRLDVDE